MNARQINYVPLRQLLPARANPKRHDLDAITGSIDKFGFVEPVLRDGRTGRLISGHGREEALSAMRDRGDTPPEGVRLADDGDWLIPVIDGWTSRSDAEADAYLVIANHHPTLAGWDHQALSDLLAGVDDDLRDVVRFDQSDLDDLVRANTAPDLDDLADELGDPDPKDTWPLIRFPAPPVTRAAWQSHVDACGAPEHEALAALLDKD